MVGTAPSSSDCIAYWKMEDNTDSSGNGNTLTVNGATSGATGIIDDCYRFDAVNDYMTINNSEALPQNNTYYSMSIWFKFDNNPTATEVIVIADYSAATNGLFGIIVDASANLIIYPKGTVGFTVNSGDIVLTDWNHVVAIRDGTTVRAYLNGNSLGSDTGNSLKSSNGDAALNIGTSRTHLNQFFDGLIDEVCVFDVALSADEVEYLYNGGSPGSDQQYPFAPVDSVTISSPNGGEVYVQGRSVDVSWSFVGSVGDLTIEFSDDDGASYSVVSSGVDVDDGSFSWVVPVVVSSSCLIRVGDGTVSDVSDAVFSVVGPPAKSVGGGRFVHSWLAPINNFFERGKGFVEQSNGMILSYVPSDHLQITGDFVATVVNVHDGDTVRLMTSFRDFDFPLRLANVDADELGHGGESARDWLKSRIEGREVLVVVNPKNRVGKYGRLIGEIFFNGFNINDEMMRRGIVAPFGKKNEGSIEPFRKILVRAGY
jgi:endonuclease YncB( thermonuclease family)